MVLWLRRARVGGDTFDLSSELKRKRRARKGRRSVSSFSRVRLCRRELVVRFSSSLSSMVHAEACAAEMRESSCSSTMVEECAKTYWSAVVTRPTVSHDLPFIRQT